MYKRGPKIKVRRVSATSRGPQGLPTQAASSQKRAPSPSIKPRPAPAVQPGPVSNAERRTIARAKRTPAYKQKVQATRTERLHAVAEKDAAATRTGMSDSDRKRAQDYYKTKAFSDALDSAAKAGAPKQSVIGGLLSPKASPSTEVNYRLKQFQRHPNMNYLKGAPDLLAAAVKSAGRGQQQIAKLDSGAVKILNQTMRTSRAVSGATEQIVKGHPEKIPGAAVKGLIGNKGPGFGKILRQAGAPKGVAAAAGFGLDVATDPLTYATFGTGTAAEHAAARAAKEAAKQGLDDTAVKTAATTAAKSAKGSASKGITVDVAGRGVPGVTRATGKAAEVAGNVASSAASKPVLRKVAPKVRAAGAGVKDLGRDVRPQLRPVGVSEGEHVAARQAARKARAVTTQGAAQSEREARDLAKRIGQDNYATVIDAIERNRIGSLPEDLRQPAIDIRSKFRHAQKVRKQSGLAEGSVRNYFPHAQEESLHAGLGLSSDTTAKRMGRDGKVVPRPGSAKTRDLKMPLSDANKILKAEDRGKFSTDAPLVYLNYMDETSKVAAQSRLVRDVAATGRPVKPGVKFDEEAGDRVYHVGFTPTGSESHVVGATKKGGELVVQTPRGKGRFGLRPSTLTEALNKPRDGQYVILNEKVVQNTLESAAPKEAGSAIGRNIDRGTRGFKKLATFTPGFHARNAIGDTQMAYLGQPGHKIPGNIKAGGTALRVVSRQETHPFARELSGKTVKIRGKQVPVEQFVQQARDHGVIRSGYIGRELEDLAQKTGKTAKAVGGRKHRPLARANRWMQNREDVTRLATFKSGLDDGLTPAAAADKAANFHIDYGDLTEFERRYARRLMPFYTFSARALPIHAKALLKNPGKYAAIEKARENSVDAFSGEDNYKKAVDQLKAAGVKPSALGWKSWQDGLQEFQQRSIPGAGPVGTAISAALPATILNELPTGFSPAGYLSELQNYGWQMANPLAKWPVELFAGKNLFLRKDIENPRAPLVSAPSWVKYLPDSAKQAWGVTDQYVDPRSKKKTWGWYGKEDYIARSLPGAVGFVNSLATGGSSRRGQNKSERVAAFATGVRVEPYDPLSTAITALGKRHADIVKQIGALGQEAKNSADPHFAELDATRKLIEYQTKALSARRGDTNPSYAKAKKPGKNDLKIAKLSAKAAELAAPLNAKAKKGEIVYETPELKRVRAEIKALKGPQPKQARVLKRPLTPREQIVQEIADFKAQQKPGAAQAEIRREIEKFKAQAAAAGGG